MTDVDEKMTGAKQHIIYCNQHVRAGWSVSLRTAVSTSNPTFNMQQVLERRMFNVLLTSMNCGGVTWPDLWSGPRIGDSSKTNHVRTNHGLSKKVYSPGVSTEKFRRFRCFRHKPIAGTPWHGYDLFHENIRRSDNVERISSRIRNVKCWSRTKTMSLQGNYGYYTHVFPT